MQEICKYLNLDSSYFKLVRRFSSDTASLATQSTRIHNELLINIISSDAFNSYNEENYNLLLTQLIDNLTTDLKQDLSLIGFPEINLSKKIKEVINEANKIIKESKLKVEKLIIKEPFDE